MKEILLNIIEITNHNFKTTRIKTDVDNEFSQNDNQINSKEKLTSYKLETEGSSTNPGTCRNVTPEQNK